MALVMMFSFSFGALAATSDPNVTGYNTPWTQVFGTNQLQPNGGVAYVFAGPANSSWAFTGYDSPKDAVKDMTWSIVPGGTADVYISSQDAVGATGGTYAARAVIGIEADSPSGSVSIQGTRNNGQSVNFTIVVNQTNFLNIIVPESGITVGSRFYNGSISTPLASASSISVNPASYADSRSFNTVLDSLAAADAANVVDSFVAAGGYVSSITINAVPYAEKITGEGWNYRVYRDTNSDNIYELQPFSAVVGASDYKLANGDIIVWIYGTYTVTFPGTIS